MKKELYTPDNIHLSPAGYAVYAAQLKPVLEAMLAGKPVLREIEGENQHCKVTP